MTYYVYAEDLASALIGPFHQQSVAETHIIYCQRRGDGAEMRVVDSAEAALLRPDIGTECTPREDRAYTRIIRKGDR